MTGLRGDGPNDDGPSGGGPHGIGSSQARPDEARRNDAGPGGTTSSGVTPGKAKPGQTRPDEARQHEAGRRAPRLRELAALFLKLGTIAFGGPAAHTAMMEDEVVRRRGWLTREAFLDLVGATNLIPGPNSTELAIHIGYQRAGGLGLVVAGACFILPAALIVTAAAWAYVRYGQIPEADALLYGVKPVIIAIVLQALAGLTRTAVKTPLLAVVGLGALALCALGVHELLLLAAAALLMAIAGWWRGGGRRRDGSGRGGSGRGAAGAEDRGRDERNSQGGGQARSISMPALATWWAAGDRTIGEAAIAVGSAATATATAMTSSFSLTSLFLFFLKVGSVLFGSGYVLLAFLRADLVERWGWLTNAQLLDAVAIGQITPGPLFTTATFIGYLLGGPAGAAVATVGIFLPAFVFVALSGPLVPRVRRSAPAGAALDGVIVASLALMAYVTWELARSALIDPPTIAAALIAGVLLVRWRVNSAWLVIAGALLGLAVGR